MFYQLDQFGFRALWSPYLFLFILVIIGLFFFVTIKEDNIPIFKYKHFWVGVIFLFFWSITYTFWALSNVITENAVEYSLPISNLLLTVNMIAYSSLSIVFILNKKHILHNGN